MIEIFRVSVLIMWKRRRNKKEKINKNPFQNVKKRNKIMKMWEFVPIEKIS